MNNMLNSLKFNKIFNEAVRQSSSLPDERNEPFKCMNLKSLIVLARRYGAAHVINFVAGARGHAV